MTRGFAALLALTAAWPLSLAAQDRPTFRTAVSRVTLSATVRTTRGKSVTNLKADDFELYDSGERRAIQDFKTEAAPVNIAVLVDFSGSMDVAAKRRAATDSVSRLLDLLRPGDDRAGLYVFDRELRELQSLAPAPGNILAQLNAVTRPFGATSLFDAIADTGKALTSVTGTRRAVVALTDGADNASRLTPEQVSGIASSIDVPVYVIIVVSPLDRMGQTTVIEERLARELDGPLANLARWTGGEIFAAVNPTKADLAVQQIVTDLRQQYFIAFEPGARTGWHPIELRTKDRNHVVRTRSGYIVQEQPDKL